jgi:hypothetical protein
MRTTAPPRMVISCVRRLATPSTGPYPATMTVTRTADTQCLISFTGNRYSVPPELARTTLNAVWRLSTDTIGITTAAGTVIAGHRRAPDCGGVMVRDTGHPIALEHVAMQAFNATAPRIQAQLIE